MSGLRALLVLTSCGALLSAASQQPQPAGRGAIAGRVVDTRGAGVPGAEVMIGGPSGWMSNADGSSIVRHVIADEHGDFAFDKLPRGVYEFAASKTGYSSVIYDRPGGFRQSFPTKLADGERRLDVVITITKLSVVAGTITDDIGAPATGVAVTALMPTVRGGRFKLVGVRSSVTNDRGQYRITQLEPGRYALAIQDSRRLRIADQDTGRIQTTMIAPMLYPPKARDLGPSDLLQVGAGQEMTDVDLRAGRVPAAQVSGTVIGSGDDRGTSVRLRSNDDIPFGMSAISRVSSVRPDGTFLFEGIAPGQYVLDAIRTIPFSGDQPQQRRPSWSASMPLVVGTADIADLTLPLRSGPSLSGRFVFDGASRPPDLATLRESLDVRLESADGNYYNIDPYTSRSGAEFTVTGAVPGRYIVRPPEQLGQWRLRSVLIDGRDVSVLPLNLTSDVRDVVVTFTDRQTVLRGTAPRETLIVVFPADSRLWTDYGASPRRFADLGTGPAETFSIQIPPGEYFVAATTNAIQQVWRERGLLERLAASADRVTLREGDDLIVTPRMVTVR